MRKLFSVIILFSVMAVTAFAQPRSLRKAFPPKDDITLESVVASANHYMPNRVELDAVNCEEIYKAFIDLGITTNKDLYKLYKRYLKKAIKDDDRICKELFEAYENGMPLQSSDGFTADDINDVYFHQAGLIRQMLVIKYGEEKESIIRRSYDVEPVDVSDYDFDGYSDSDDSDDYEDAYVYEDGEEEDDEDIYSDYNYFVVFEDYDGPEEPKLIRYDPSATEITPELMAELANTHLTDREALDQSDCKVLIAICTKLGLVTTEELTALYANYLNAGLEVEQRICREIVKNYDSTGSLSSDDGYSAEVENIEKIRSGIYFHQAGILREMLISKYGESLEPIIRCDVRDEYELYTKDVDTCYDLVTVSGDDYDCETVEIAVESED